MRIERLLSRDNPSQHIIVQNYANKICSLDFFDIRCHHEGEFKGPCSNILNIKEINDFWNKSCRVMLILRMGTETE